MGGSIKNRGCHWIENGRKAGKIKAGKIKAGKIKADIIKEE